MTVLTDALSFSCITEASAFRELEGDWDDLLARLPGASVFNSWAWLYSWWEAYRPGELRILCWRAHEGGRLVGVVPLYLDEEPLVRGVTLRVLRFVGDGSSDSDYLDILTDDATQKAVADSLFEWLHKLPRWSVLVLDTLPGKSSSIGALTRNAIERGLTYRVTEQPCCALTLPTSFEEFLVARRPRFRTKLRALMRRFEDDDQLTFEDQCAEVSQARIESLFELHQRRWQDAGLPGVFGDERKRQFYAIFTKRFMDRGWLRLYSLKKDGTYVAHELCFGLDHRTMLLQEGFDTGDAKASYGQMLRALVLKHLTATLGGDYDFLGGFTKHKADWGAEPLELRRFVLAGNQARGQVYVRLPEWRELASRSLASLGLRRQAAD